MTTWCRTLAALTSAAAVGLSAACSGGATASGPVSGTWDDVVAAAKDEGSVYLYSSQHPENLASVKARFEATYPGITVEFTRGSDVELNPRVDAEHKSGRGIGDVHMTTDPAWIRAAADSGEYSVNVVGPSFDNPDYGRDTSVVNDKLFLTSAAVLGLGWNTTALPDGLDSPEDLLAPELRGRVGVVNPAGFAAVTDQFRFFDRNWSPDYTDELAQNEPRVYPGVLAVAQGLGSGEIIATPMVQPLVREQEAGAPVGWFRPDPAWGAPYYSHVLASAPHPNAAQLLADFLVSPEGQQALSKGYASVLPNIPESVGRAQDIALTDPADLDPAAVTEYQAEWEQRFIR